MRIGKIFLLGCILLSGCTSSYKDYKSLSTLSFTPGTTTKQDVSRQIGFPSQSLKDGDNDVWVYHGDSESSSYLIPIPLSVQNTGDYQRVEYTSTTLNLDNKKLAQKSVVFVFDQSGKLISYKKGGK